MSEAGLRRVRGTPRIFSEAEAHRHRRGSSHLSRHTPARWCPQGTGCARKRGPGVRNALPPVWTRSRRKRTQRKSQAPRAPLIAVAALGSELRCTFLLSPECAERGKAEPPEPRAAGRGPSSQRPPTARRPRPSPLPLLASPPSLALGSCSFAAASGRLSCDVLIPWG